MTTQISGHRIKWHVQNKKVTKLTDFEQERIADLIKEDYQQGEINMSYHGKNNVYYETTGWWEIVNWEDIALELYNALKGCNPLSKDMKKAIDRFDKNWE